MSAEIDYTQYDIKVLALELKRLEDGIKDLEAKVKERLAPAKDRARKIRGELLRRLAAGDTKTIAFDNIGTITRRDRVSYSILDPKEFQQYVLQAADFSMFGASLASAGVAQYLEANQQLPPGIASNLDYELQFRPK